MSKINEIYNILSTSFSKKKSKMSKNFGNITQKDENRLSSVHPSIFGKKKKKKTRNPIRSSVCFFFSKNFLLFVPSWICEIRIYAKIKISICLDIFKEAEMKKWFNDNRTTIQSSSSVTKNTISSSSSSINDDQIN